MIYYHVTPIDPLIKHSAFKLATSKFLSSYWMIKVGILFTYLLMCPSTPPMYPTTPHMCPSTPPMYPITPPTCTPMSPTCASVLPPCTPLLPSCAPVLLHVSPICLSTEYTKEVNNFNLFLLLFIILLKKMHNDNIY